MFTESIMSPKLFFKWLETKNSYEVRLSIESKNLGKYRERTKLLNRKADSSTCKPLSIQIGPQLLTTCMLSDIDFWFNAQLIL